MILRKEKMMKGTNLLESRSSSHRDRHYVVGVSIEEKDSTGCGVARRASVDATLFIVRLTSDL